jgi:hypothetical protein
MSHGGNKGSGDGWDRYRYNDTSSSSADRWGSSSSSSQPPAKRPFEPEVSIRKRAPDEPLAAGETMSPRMTLPGALGGNHPLSPPDSPPPAILSQASGTAGLLALTLTPHAAPPIPTGLPKGDDVGWVTRRERPQPKKVKKDEVSSVLYCHSPLFMHSFCMQHRVTWYASLAAIDNMLASTPWWFRSYHGLELGVLYSAKIVGITFCVTVFQEADSAMFPTSKDFKQKREEARRRQEASRPDANRFRREDVVAPRRSRAEAEEVSAVLLVKLHQGRGG